MVTTSSIREREGEKYGGSSDGIRSHYDISNEFWPAVLGRTMTYSCALFSTPQDSLDVAQGRKIDWHLVNSGALNSEAVLDVGCGWGSLLRPIAERGRAGLIRGITLSEAQLQYVKDLKLPNVEVKVENWADHKPGRPYDSIVSVGAFEHFAKPDESEQEKIAVYRDFFERCHRWLSPDGMMTLQTIAYNNMDRGDASKFINQDIFPDSDLPYLREILAALDGLFEVLVFRNDRLDYARTMDAWNRNLQKFRGRSVDLVGEKKVGEMERFFRMASMGFRMGKQGLLRLCLRPISRKWSTMATERWQPRLADTARYGAP
jgi:cyclopropane-fatty-acyl-phospholipid synthase